jgi:uncharacterized protein (TIGR03435 family)
VLLRVLTTAWLLAAAGAQAQPPRSQVATSPRAGVRYELVMVKKGTLGPQLVESDTDCAQEAARFSSGGPVCMMLATRSFLNGDSRTMAQLAAALETYLKAPVVDRTGLAGAFHMTVRWSKPGAAAEGPPEGATPEEVAAMLIALQEQLGLTVRAAR